VAPNFIQKIAVGMSNYYVSAFIETLIKKVQKRGENTLPGRLSKMGQRRMRTPHLLHDLNPGED